MDGLKDFPSSLPRFISTIPYGQSSRVIILIFSLIKFIYQPFEILDQIKCCSIRNQISSKSVGFTVSTVKSDKGSSRYANALVFRSVVIRSINALTNLTSNLPQRCRLEIFWRYPLGFLSSQLNQQADFTTFLGNYGYEKYALIGLHRFKSLTFCLVITI